MGWPLGTGNYLRGGGLATKRMVCEVLPLRKGEERKKF